MNGRVVIADSQREVRAVFLSGSVGSAVSGTIWLASATAATWGTIRTAVILLVVGGMFIFPLTRLVLGLFGRPSSLGRGHPMNGLATQVAFIVPLTLPVAGAAALYEPSWFYPAVMVIVGAHYLPFVFLYGMGAFAILAAALVAAGLALALGPVEAFAAGGWITAFALIAFAAWAGVAHEREFGRAGGGRPAS